MASLQGDEEEQALLAKGRELLATTAVGRLAGHAPPSQTPANAVALRSDRCPAPPPLSETLPCPALAAAHVPTATQVAPKGAYLGLCYQKWGGEGVARGRATNHFVLLGPNGSLAWDYPKAFPVPVVESHIVAGVAPGAGGGWLHMI